MNGLLERFAADYAAAEDRLTGQGDDQSSIHYPAVFLFIGDKTADAIEPMMAINERKWDNSAGVMYFHVGTPAAKIGDGNREDSYSLPVDGDGSSSSANDRSAQSGQHRRVSRFILPASVETGSKTLRKDWYMEFQQDERHLSELNKALRQLSHHIADYGRLYSSFDRIHLSIITRVEDPLNVFIPQISLLAQSIFSQSFKSVQMDLYALISEREQVDSFGYDSSSGIAFLRELDDMQRPDYSYSAPLLVTEDGISIPVTHTSSPLFDLVYVLSDKNERGISVHGHMQDNYEIICHLSLLKNRKSKESSYDTGAGSYNNTSFKNNLMTESGRQGYVSAGFSKVKRPNHSIALTVLYHFWKQLMQRMKNGGDWSVKEKMAFLGIDPGSVSSRVMELVPDAGKIAEMNGMMSHPVSYGQLKRMSMREAEAALFGDGCEQYFRENYIREVQSRMERVDPTEELAGIIRKSLSEHPEISYFQVAEWTDEKKMSGVMEFLQARIRDLAAQVESERGQLEQYVQTPVEEQPFQKLPLMDKHNLRSFIRYFFDAVYQRRLELLMLETELKLYRRYEAELVHLQAYYKRQTDKMEALLRELHDAAQRSIRSADDYIGQNIMDYYGLVTEEVMREVENKRGARIFFEDRYVGSITELLERVEDQLIERLIVVCKRDLLTAEHFVQTFEEELLRRANVTIDYSNKQVLSKEELFKKLYRTLEEHAVINVRLFDYTQEHRYEEKYFFGDAESEFIRYALGADETSRIYKLGVVHEKRASGVEKLNIMGGFHLEDLMYYRNGKMYYETYVQNRYEFHGIDPERLPKLR